MNEFVIIVARMDQFNGVFGAISILVRMILIVLPFPAEHFLGDDYYHWIDSVKIKVRLG